MNMRSALLHVGADLVRSMVTVAEGCLVIFFHADGRSTDAYASLIVSLTVLVGAAAGMVSWTRLSLRILGSQRADTALLCAE
ncbi:unnamed protein product [Symbiodinium pilosum]|uniref:Uncharacterized protein n=1 Tax=Symbiodinium pilosum TaxID=2952 RepID=A0A812XKK9_SYMPI|nr:unnamed protein product [Symbiodinium pilosum]